jgi:plasmid maintenance system antidote protein VapI
MSTSDKPEPISTLLRQVVTQAVGQGRTTYLALERETGLSRASIRRFVNGERSLRLDMADRLAARFGLELRTARRKKG